MTAVKSHNVVLSDIEISIASTLTRFPGVTKADFKTGKNVTYEKGDLKSDYDEVQDSGVQSGASISGSAQWDPLDATQQFIQTQKNNSHVVSSVYTPISGNVVVGATGVEVPVKMLCTVWDLKADRKQGWIVDFEFEITERVELNEADPA